MAGDIEQYGLREQAEALRLYANSSINPEKIPELCLTFINKNGIQKLITWGFFGEDGCTFNIPMKKTIYDTSGFADLILL